MSDVCAKCVGDPVLKQWIEQTGDDIACAFCDNEDGPSITVQELADRIDEPLRQFYKPGLSEPRMSSNPDDDHMEWYQDGQELLEVLQEVCEIGPDVAEMLTKTLLLAPESGDDGGFAWDDDTRLVHIDPDPTEWRQLWEEFEQRIKHSSRFFDTKADEYLNKLIGDLARFRNGAALLHVGPQTAYESLFRARLAQSEEQAREFVRDPLAHLVPPPPSGAKPGRMNPAGIPVFYGAFSPDVCIAEVRSHVGGVVVVGQFRFVQPLTLLDLSYFGRTFYSESMFLPEYGEIVNRLAFLRELQETLSRPVTPSDEPLEYVPTQAVAEFIARRLHLHGVVYNSSQTGPPDEDDKPQDELPLFRIFSKQPVSQCNVALFGDAAKVGHMRSNDWNADGHVRKPRYSLELGPEDPEPRRVTGIQVWSEIDHTLYPVKEGTEPDHDEEIFD
jgi:hypothetical protein